MLPESSLAHVLCAAARVVAEVMAGHNLTGALARMRQETRAQPAAIQDLAYTTLRRYGRDDFYLSRLMQKPLPPGVLSALLRVALSRLAQHPQQAHAIVHQAVDAAGALAGERSKALVNGVLRNFLRRRAELEAAAQQDLVARWQHPAWWIARLRRRWPRDWQRVLEWSNAHPPMALRVNRRRIAAADFLARLEAAGVAARSLGGEAVLLERPLPVERLPGFAEGLCSVQDAAAQQAAALLDVGDGQRVLDACAAPGGKTAHLLERADLDLLALEADPQRTARIDENLQRLGLRARVLSADCRQRADWWDGRAFDRILADVPCSAAGVVRRHPDIKWLRQEADIARFARSQREILDALWPTLKPGGKLLYASCTLFGEENDEQAATFAARHADCVRLPIAEAASRPSLDGQLLPDAEHDGFYYALFEKRI